MKEVQRYLKILRDIRAGKAPSKGDLKFFSTFTYDVDEKALEELKNSPEFKDLPADQVSQAMQDSFLLAVQQPEYREDMIDIAKENTKTELGKNIAAGLNLALGATDVLNSASQVRAANRAARRLQRPSRPAALTADPLLGAALEDARDQTGEVSRALAPAQMGLLDNYLSDLNVAKSVSGGQAGTYGALSQVASNRRNRGAVELAPIADQVARRGEMRYDQLLAQKLQENQAIQQSQAQYYPTDVYQYGQDAESVASLGATGRQNLRDSIGATAGFLPEIAANLGARKRFRDIYNSGSAYGPNNAKIMADADYNLRYGNADPSIQSQYEDVYGIHGNGN